jgi:cyclase
MLRIRVIPTLLLQDGGLVKTVRFDKPAYIGDPINTCRIFNELEVDELVLLDIRATLKRQSPDLDLLRRLTDECFMPLAYGGGIKDLSTAEQLFALGIEKVILNSAPFDTPALLPSLAHHFGSQSLVAAIDVRQNWLGHYEVYSHSATRNQHRTPVAWAQELESMGAGEILLTAVDREGTWSGFDTQLVRRVADAISIPVIAHGGAGHLDHLRDVVQGGHASAIALGSMVVFQQKGMGVLVNLPDLQRIHDTLEGA